jgi:hypothetical protein
MTRLRSELVVSIGILLATIAGVVVALEAPGTPLATKITLEEVPNVPLFLTLAFAHVFPTESTLVSVFSNAIKVTEIPIPQ